jgi:hypothetical protein
MPAPPPDETKDDPTGILIDLRSLGEQVPAGRSFAVFRVVTPDGEDVLSSADVPDEVRRANPVFWQADPTAVLGPAQLPPVGDSPWIATVVSLTIEETADDVEAAVLLLGKKSAESARTIANLRDLAAAGRLVILVREAE